LCPHCVLCIKLFLKMLYFVVCQLVKFSCNGEEKCQYISKYVELHFISYVWLRLVFTSGSRGWIHNQKCGAIQFSENQTSRIRTLIPLMNLCWSQSSENCIVGVASRSGRMNQSQCWIPGFVTGWFFHFYFWQSSFLWVTNNRVLNGIVSNGYRYVLILPSLILSSLWLNLRLWLSLGHKPSYNYGYDSDHDTITSDNQLLVKIMHN